MEQFTHVCLDGILLRSLVAPSAPRTSADLVLPLLFERAGANCRVALIGSTRASLAAAEQAIRAASPNVEVVLSRDGYEELSPPEAMAAAIREADADVVVVGLGAPLQDAYLLALRAHGLRDRVLLTCGGWLDQVSNMRYYPRFAYRLKINWLVRVVREPRRLWRRYTVDAVAAVRRRQQMRRFLLVRGAVPLGVMLRACSPGAVVDRAPESSQVELVKKELVTDAGPRPVVPAARDRRAAAQESYAVAREAVVTALGVTAVD